MPLNDSIIPHMLDVNSYDRREFLKGMTCAAFCGAGIAGLGSEMADDGFAALQKEVAEIPGSEFLAFVHGATMAEDRSCIADSECEAMYARYPILRRYDDAFRKVVREMRETDVGDAPAVWYVYNMGVIVKTHRSVFSIDLSHRLAPTIADELDFAVITHNHLDHYTEAFYRAMNSRHKTVVSNFRDNYGACLHVKDGIGGFSRGERTFELGGVTVHTYESDHNHLLRGFVMPVEVCVGDYTILHVGDTFNTGDLKPRRTPDLFIHHAWCWETRNQTIDGINAFRPRCAVIAHHLELGHNGGGRRPLSVAYAKKAEAEAAGVRAVAPFWGDRIA